MFTLSTRGIRAHLGRFVLTGLAIAMSVGFLTGSLILFPTTTKMIDGMIGQSVGGVNVVVRRQQLDETSNGVREPDAQLADQIAGLPNVTAVQTMRYEQTTVSLTNGKSLGTTEASSWAGKPFNIGHVAEGREPRGLHEIVIDRGTARANALKVGNSVSVSVAGSKPTPFSIVGVATFGESESVGGMSVFVTAKAMEAATQTQARINWILVAGTGPETSLQRSVRAKLPEGIEAISGAEYKAEQRKGFASTIVFFKSIIGGFAVVSFFVGAFLIANTFSIIVAQRTKEVALLRAIGAMRKQVKRMVLLEALMVSAFCSVIGLGVGILMAKVLIALLESSTGMPDPGPLVMPPSAFGIGILVGVCATVAAAWMPIRRGTKVEPVAALRNDDIQVVPRSSRVRTVLGVLMIALAFGLGFAPVSDQRFLVGVLGSVVGLIGVAFIAPTLVVSFFNLLRPIFGRGAIGELAIDGARRSPRRTASTAAALMIGLSLVTGALVMVNSMKESVGSQFERQVRAATVLLSGELSDDVVNMVRTTGGVEKLQTLAFGRMINKGVAKDVTALSTDQPLIDLEVSQGKQVEQLQLGEVLVYKDVFKDGVSVGSTIDVVFRKSGKQKLKVVGVFTNNTSTANYVISMATGQGNFVDLSANRMLVAGSARPESLAASLDSATAGRGVTVSTIASAIKRNNKQMDAFLGLIMGLLAVSMIIALLGVVNTMALAVLERTRELGMLRAVGMTRRQIRQVIRREAIAVSVFGVILGLLVGIPIGFVLVRGLASIGVNRPVIPVTQIGLVSVVALTAGVIAALLPARRAAKLDVLTAISHV